MKLLLNIGLLNNLLTVEQIIGTLQAWFETEKVEFKETTATYKGLAEKTVVIKVTTDYHITTIVPLLEDMCKLMNQESLAMVLEEYKMMIYNPNYKGIIENFKEHLFDYQDFK